MIEDRYLSISQVADRIGQKRRVVGRMTNEERQSWLDQKIWVSQNIVSLVMSGLCVEDFELAGPDS